MNRDADKSLECRMRNRLERKRNTSEREFLFETHDKIAHEQEASTTTQKIREETKI